MLKKIKKQGIALLLLLVTVVTMAFPTNAYAIEVTEMKNPDLSQPESISGFVRTMQLDTEEYVKGSISNYNAKYYTFTAPEAGVYRINVINASNANTSMYFFNEYWQGRKIMNPQKATGWIPIYANGYCVDDKKNGVARVWLNSGDILNMEIYSYEAYVTISKEVQQTDTATTTTTKTPAINKKSVSFSVGDRQTLKIKYNKKEVKWVSTNSKVVTVSKSGVIKAKGTGTAYVWAIVENKAYKCKVKVSIELKCIFAHTLEK